MEIRFYWFCFLRIGCCEPILFIFRLNLKHFDDANWSFLGLEHLRLFAFNEGDSSWLCALPMLFLLLLYPELIDLRILVLTHAAITPRRLSITAILLFMRIAPRLLLMPIRLSFQSQEGLNDSRTHFMIIRDLELSYPVILKVSKQRAFNCKDICYVQLSE